MGRKGKGEEKGRRRGHTMTQLLHQAITLAQCSKLPSFSGPSVWVSKHGIKFIFKLREGEGNWVVMM